MPELRNFERKGERVSYSVYDDDGHFLRGSDYDAGAEIEEARARHLSLRRLIETKEAAKEAPAPDVSVLPSLPEAPQVKDHTHEEFSYPLADHQHPHDHKEEFAAFYARLEALWDQLQVTLARFRDHTHPEYLSVSHSHAEYAVAEHLHSLEAHQHALPEHVHPFPVHGHDFTEHEHPYAALAHGHQLEEHLHPFVVHNHPMPEHKHGIESHSHEVGPHDHPVREHVHASTPHDHDLITHDHPHNHPHRHPEFGEDAEAREHGPHLHDFTRNLGDGKGYRCNICGLPKDEA